jgi:hypothetical protein
MARGTNLQRVKDLQSAIRRAKPDDKLSLTELAMIWGVTKGAFVNVRQKMMGFPAGEQGPGNSTLYPATPALKIMLDYETRADEEERERQSRAAAIMGLDRKGPGRRKKAEVFLPPSELLKLSRLRAEIEERERNQGEYVPRSDVRATAARVYALLSEHLGQLELRVDPNGLLPAETRNRIGENGRKALLAIHSELSDMLGGDVDHGPSGTETARGAARRTGAASPRRKRKTGVRKPA